MDRQRTINFAISSLIFFVLIFLYSKFGPAIPLSFATQNRGEPMIVSAEGKVITTPDLAKVNVGIEQSGTTLKSVQESVNKKSQDLTKSLKDFGIKEEDIKTTSYNIYPENNYETNPPSITGYRVNASYEIKVRDIEKVNEVLTTVTSNGANVVGGITFDISDELRNEKLNEARKEASDKAKEKAKGLAQASGITLGKIINISESEGVDYGRPIPLLEKADIGLGGGGAPTPANIQPGQTEITISVTLFYEVR